MSEIPTIPSLPQLPELPLIPEVPGARHRPRGAADMGPPDDLGAVEASELFRALAQAIDREQVVQVRFAGETEARRICPDRIGIDAHDQFQVEAFQLSGPSASGQGEAAWKCFHLHNLEIVGVEEEGWVPGPRASTAGACFHQVVYPVPGTQ